ncbi:MAG: site-specific DNA-methyltransferase [Victivallales bacterium]|nr:site-specific DNA-methyltransferase [Victivallales bacterium]
MEKMDGKTMDIVAENVGKLKELFPEAFTEGKVDFETLKEVLGTFVDDRDERYSFTWNGKSKARMIAQTPSTGTLRPCKEESVDWDTTQNIFIEGDNLEVLKLLQKSYHKKVKMIYIDPPYNTGKDFVYKDNFKDNIKNYKQITGQVDGEGRNLSNNPETSGRYHTDWLNMMYPRLKLARNLLKDEGVIFISIDDNEVSNLRKMCDEIFGEENFIADIVWQKKTSPDARMNISTAHDHIILYSKAIELNQLAYLPFDKERKKSFTNPDNDPRGDWASVDLTGQTGRAPKSQFYTIETPSGIKMPPPDGRCWALAEATFIDLVKDNRIWFGKDGNNRPRLKKFLSESEGTRPWTWWDNKSVGHNQEASQEVKALFDNQTVFDNPKPVRLIQRIVQLSTSEDDIILDFFAGSGTTAHSIFTQNIADNYARKFVLIQIPQGVTIGTNDFKSNSVAYNLGYKVLTDISKERIRRAAAKIKEENPEYEGDLGFKVFKLDSTNIKPWEVDFDMTERTLEDFISNIKSERREEDVLYEVLLKYGLDLTLPISEHIIAEKKVFDIGMGALIICLSNAISLEVVEGIAKLKDELNPEIMRVVFKDSGFKDDVVKTNAVQILKQAGIVDVRSL